jgi:hypothetical protein
MAAGAVGGAASRTVSPLFPVTIWENISWSAGMNAYRKPATTMATKIKAAQILLKAMETFSLHVNAPNLALIA